MTSEFGAGTKPPRVLKSGRLRPSSGGGVGTGFSGGRPAGTALATHPPRHGKRTVGPGQRSGTGPVLQPGSGQGGVTQPPGSRVTRRGCQAPSPSVTRSGRPAPQASVGSGPGLTPAPSRSVGRHPPASAGPHPCGAPAPPPGASASLFPAEGGGEAPAGPPSRLRPSPLTGRPRSVLGVGGRPELGRTRPAARRRG